MLGTLIAMPQIIAGLRYQATTQTFFNSCLASNLESKAPKIKNAEESQ